MPPQPILNTGPSGKSEASQNVSPLAKEFPDWDLMPPAILVRRKSASSGAMAPPPPTTTPLTFATRNTSATEN